MPTSTRLSAWLAERAAGLLRVRWVVRAPIWLYRARLGVLFGSRLLLLEHVGRSTGATRRVVLEVVSRPAPERYIVASGFGTTAQWYRNVQAHPEVKVQVGSRAPRAATAVPLTADESAAALREYAAADPRAWSALRPVFETTLGASIDQHGTSLPMMALDIRADPKRPGR
jgi:deazaflavin-dependent oxidoreductase (nitroreductase family)